MTTLEEFWTVSAPTASPKRRKPKKALQHCEDCGLMSWGVRCQPCQWAAMRAPLGKCSDCKAPMHRRSTPADERKPGSRRHQGGGRCTVCYNIANGKTKPRDGRRPETKRRMAVAPIEPSPDESPLTDDELLRALCSQADPEAWFPDKGSGTHDAKKVCGRCPIQARCLAVSLTIDPEPEGVWGGTSVRTRRKLRQEREAALQAALEQADKQEVAAA